MRHAVWLDLRHDLFRICVLIAFCAYSKNFLPRNRFKNARLRQAYQILIDLLAGFGGGWRADSPSLQQEWMGFKAKRRPRMVHIELRLAPDEECAE